MHARTVPSPPATNTTAAPSSTACFACPVPGSSAVVSSHAGSGQPASASCSVMPARSSSRPSTRFGLTMTAVRRGPPPSRCSAAGWVVASWGVVTVASMSRGSPTGHSGACDPVQRPSAAAGAPRGWSGSRSRRRGPGSCPSRRITACDRSLDTAVNETISVRPTSSKPTASASRAASVAYPCPQAQRGSRQPTSTIDGSHDGRASPVNPANRPSTSSAHSPQPFSRSRACARAASASLASRVRVPGKNSITSGSAFSSANGSRSASVHCRISRRSVRRSSVITAPYASAVISDVLDEWTPRRPRPGGAAGGVPGVRRRLRSGRGRPVAGPRAPDGQLLRPHGRPVPACCSASTARASSGCSWAGTWSPATSRWPTPRTARRARRAGSPTCVPEDGSRSTCTGTSCRPPSVGAGRTGTSGSSPTPPPTRCPVVSDESEQVAWFDVDDLPAGTPDDFAVRLRTVLDEVLATR